MIDELEEAPDQDFFGRVEGVDGELQRLMSAPEYGDDVSELSTRHDVPAFVEDDCVTKVFPEGVNANVVEDNHLVLSEYGISFPSGLYWVEEVGGEEYGVVQHVKALGSQDPGFWDEFNDRVHEFQVIGDYAVDRGLYLDFKPQNFGFLDDEMVYVDTTDGGAVKTDESDVGGEMADSLLRGMEQASVAADEYSLRQVARELDPGLSDRYSSR